MKLTVLLWCGIFVALAFAEENSNFIVGGEDATIEEYPYMAGILNFGLFGCGGTIINPRAVLTAAHCILSDLPGSISVFVGSSRRRGQGGRTHRALRVIKHPEYKYIPEPFEIYNDVAVIRLIQTIQFGVGVQPIPLGTEPVPAGAQIKATGWGLLGDSFLRDRADQLQKIEMTTLSNLLCSLLHRGTVAEGMVTDEKICLVAPGQRGVCGGDSGGPITWRGAVVGIACWTVRPCGSHPSVYVRVEKHLSWIRQQM